MNDIGNAFIKGTAVPDFSTVDLVLRVPEPPHELPVREGQTVIKLPSPKKFKVPDIPVRTAIEGWEPVGFFTRSSITLKELSFLLWCTQGFKRTVAETIQLRNIPSSGSRYRSRPTLLQAMWMGLRRDSIATSRNLTASWPNGSIPA